MNVIGCKFFFGNVVTWGIFFLHSGPLLFLSQVPKSLTSACCGSLPCWIMSTGGSGNFITSWTKHSFHVE